MTQKKQNIKTAAKQSGVKKSARVQTRVSKTANGQTGVKKTTRVQSKVLKTAGQTGGLKANNFIQSPSKKTTSAQAVSNTKKAVSKRVLKPFEVWENLNFIPAKPVYPDNLPSDNVETALYLMSVYK